MNKILPTIIAFIFSASCSYSQHVGETFQEFEEKGTTISHLDSVYKSAVHVDPSLAVFKTENEQQAMHEAYVQLLKDLGKFLKQNNFIWGKKTRCFNRIYFAPDGSIDYFLYNFLTRNVEVKDQLSKEKQEEFRRLLNLFIKDYKLSVQAPSRFAQCSPVTYSDN